MSQVTGKDFAESAKNAGLVLTALSTAAYACGYLVIRARARALGTDPGFTLIDQAYVFAGFRFVVMLLIALLLTSPLLLLLRWIGRCACELAPVWFSALEIITVLLAGAATIWACAATIEINGLLLAPSGGRLADAALGHNSYGTLLVLATTAFGAVMLLWIDAHFARARGLDSLGAVLLLIGALVLVLLPIQHGVFYADRNARRLERVPEGLTSLTLPIWVVDRGTSDRVVLYGRGADGHARLVTLKAASLDGIAVTGVESLATAVEKRSP